MLYLVVAIVVSSLVPTILKYAKRNGLDTDIIILINYFFASVMSGITAFGTGLPQGFGSIVNAEPMRVFTSATLANSYLLVLLFGICSGILYYAALVITRQSVICNGMGITSMFSRLSFLIPLAAAAIIWGELPGMISLFGMVLGIVSLAVMLDPTGHVVNKKLMLFALLVINGMVELNNKIAVAYSAEPNFKSLFVFIIYCVAFIACGVCMIRNAIKFNKTYRFNGKIVLLGSLLGMQNVIYSFTLLKSLEMLPAALVYATAASGGVLMSNLIGVYGFKESLSKRQIVSIVLTAISLILINIG